MVQTLKMGANMLSASEKHSDQSFYGRLNSVTAATDANDVMYHKTCYVLVYNDIAMSNISDFPDDLRIYSHEECESDYPTCN